MTPTPVPTLPRNTVDHLAELIAQQSTDRLLAIVMLLGIVFLIFALVVVLRFMPLFREGNRARFEMAHAYETNTKAMEAVKDELTSLRHLIESLNIRRGFWSRVFGR